MQQCHGCQRVQGSTAIKIRIDVYNDISRWLIAHDQVDEAEQIIADLEATVVEDPYVITESKEIQLAVEYEREYGVSWWDLLRGKTGQGKTSTVRRLILGAGTQAMQQPSEIKVSHLPTTRPHITCQPS